MTHLNDLIYCDGCGVEITWAPVVSYHKVDIHPHSAAARSPMYAYRHEYCCQDCSEGRLCQCCERWELDESRRRSPSPSWPENQPS
jgi:hypothetical protein